ncbi:sigma-54 interaction domain-containing protein [Thalassobellus citreus]|uniref:sigma-54 interaction domain-containing protein n=1 Tax=Thalassobellus citreus TaxID=3367752 RepID=UPI0037A8628E
MSTALKNNIKDGFKSHYCHKAGRFCKGDTELPLLFEISTMINNTRFIKDIMAPVMELVARYLDAERSILSILNREVSKILIEASYGMSYDDKKQGRYLVGEGITGNVVKSGEPIFIDKIEGAQGFVNKTKMELQTKNNKDISFVIVPIKVDNEIVGTLSISRVYDERVNKNELIRILSVIGSMLAQAVRAKQDRMEEIERLKNENKKLHLELENRFSYENIIGNCFKLREVFKQIEQVAKTEATVLIRGESGVGKELIADAIHYKSNRASKPFIKVNCSALPETLIESELFGHEKGAFTGASEVKKGRFELAQGGTLFIDEVGELSATMQIKLLRVLQEKQFEKLGSSKTINCNARIITATNRNLEEAIVEGEFREDLYYRLNVFPLYIPPLRERLNDIPILADHFIQKANKKNGTNILRISSSAIDALMIYKWPGNIRELENCVERAAILSTDQVIRIENLPPTLQTAESSSTLNKGTLQIIVEKVEKQLIIDCLTVKKGNVLQTAKQLKISNRKLGLRIDKYNINVDKYKGKVI